MRARRARTTCIIVRARGCNTKSNCTRVQLSSKCSRSFQDVHDNAVCRGSGLIARRFNTSPSALRFSARRAVTFPEQERKREREGENEREQSTVRAVKISTTTLSRTSVSRDLRSYVASLRRDVYACELCPQMSISRRECNVEVFSSIVEGTRINLEILCNHKIFRPMRQRKFQ